MSDQSPGQSIGPLWLSPDHHASPDLEANGDEILSAGASRGRLGAG